MATFWEIAAPSVYHMFSIILSFSYFSYFPFWFRGQDFGSGCASSWSLLTFYFFLVFFVLSITILHLICPLTLTFIK